MTPAHLTPLFIRRRRQTADAASANAPGARILERIQRLYGRVSALGVRTNQDVPRIDWWVDGVYSGRTRDTTFTWALEAGQQVQIDARAVRYADEDPAEFAPRFRPRNRTLEWTAPTQGTAARFEVAIATGQATPDASDWVKLADIKADGRWLYRLETPSLDHQTWYWFRVRTVDVNGNNPSDVVWGPEWNQGSPPAPKVKTTYSGGTLTVTAV